MKELIMMFKNEIMIFLAGAALGAAGFYAGEKMFTNEAREYGPDPDLSDLEMVEDYTE